MTDGRDGHATYEGFVPQRKMGPGYYPLPKENAMTLGKLALAEQVLNRLNTQTVSAKVAYHLAKLTGLVQKETSFFYTKRDALLTQFGTPTDVVGQFKIEDDKQPAFKAALEELLTMDVTLESKWVLNLEILGSFTFTPEDMAFLLPLIQE